MNCGQVVVAAADLPEVRTFSNRPKGCTPTTAPVVAPAARFGVKDAGPSTSEKKRPHVGRFSEKIPGGEP